MNRLAIALLTTFLAQSSAFAQDRPVVFIHGFGSGPSTWDSAAARLSSQLAMQPRNADLNWRAPYGVQAGELQQELGSLPSSVVAVGHSNGGVVARQWSRGRSIDSLITLGSPNQGAPLANHLYEWFAFLDDILFRISNVDAVFAQYVDQSVWWWLPAQWSSRFAFAFDVWRSAGNGVLSLGFTASHPVLSEMRVGSPYLADLNSGSNRDREASEVPHRVALVNVAKDFYLGGPFRILSPGNYVAWHNSLAIAGITLEGLAGVIRITADVEDQGAFDLADQLSYVAEWFLQFEEVWCRVVSDPSPLRIARCVEHDGLVPAWSQAYDLPRLPLIVRTSSPVHTAETSGSDAQLYQALTTIALVPVRSASQTPPSESEPITTLPPSSTTSGRYKISGSSCVWDAADSGPDQCSPVSASTGRYKVSGSTCVWDPDDSGPNQCTPTSTGGRYKIGNGTCYWDPNDSGPNQCTP